MGDTTGFWLAPDRSALTQVNSFSPRFRQNDTVTAMKLNELRLENGAWKIERLAP